MREKPHTSCGSALDINTWWSRQPMQAGLPIVTAWLGTDGSFTEEEVRPSPSEPGRLTNMHNGCTRSSLWRKYTVYTKILLFPVRLVRAISTHISPNPVKLQGCLWTANTLSMFYKGHRENGHMVSLIFFLRLHSLVPYLSPNFLSFLTACPLNLVHAHQQHSTPISTEIGNMLMPIKVQANFGSHCAGDIGH